jgi:uncharacterized protein
MIYSTPLQFKSPDGAGVFVGHGAIFRTKDMSGDAIQPGAFRETLAAIKARAAPLPVLFGHDMSKPIGRYTALREDATGLLVEGRLTLDTRAGKEAYALIRDRAVSGLSIGYTVPKGGSEHKGDTRLLHRIDLHEISLVAVPMHPDARVTEVKALGACADARELQQLLHHSHQFSRSKAAAAAEVLWQILRGTDGREKDEILLDAIESFNKSFQQGI